MVVLAAVAFVVYSPTLTKTIAAYESGGPGSPDFTRLAGRTQRVGSILAVLVLVLIWLMVVKPGA